jgi:large conductance mechanosensitive channel
MRILKEFKEFAIKGNMFDMAIGIIIGTAFNKIVSSLVSDVITPFLGLLIGNTKFESLQFTLQQEVRNSTGQITQELITVNYGVFLQSVIDFLIIALTVFVVIKTFNRLRSKGQDEEDASEPTPKDIVLLSEIRDLLKENSNSKMSSQSK